MPSDMPYFEGDYWPSMTEQIIHEIKKEEEEEKIAAEAEVCLLDSLTCITPVHRPYLVWKYREISRNTEKQPTIRLCLQLKGVRPAGAQHSRSTGVLHACSWPCASVT